MKGTCQKCGCTEERPCDCGDGQPCGWIDRQEDLCSRCAEDLLMERGSYCNNCGTARKPLEQRRASWGFYPQPPITPKSESAEGARYCEISPQLIVNASIYRNGGTDEHTHLCDECLRVGLRLIKREVDRLLEQSADDKHVQIAALTERLGRAEHKIWTLSLDCDLYRRELQELKQRVPAATRGGL